MSSTNRGNDRHVSDYYVTPPTDIFDFFCELSKVEPNFMNGLILDPCAGGDTHNEMSYPTVFNLFDRHGVKTIDVRKDSRAETIGDYLSMPDIGYEPDVIITNPPFSIAIPVIEKALVDVKDDGFVIMLLRLNFFGSIKRRSFFREYMPKYSFVHHKRISFTKGSTDSIEYQHCVWQKGYHPDFTKLYII